MPLQTIADQINEANEEVVEVPETTETVETAPPAEDADEVTDPAVLKLVQAARIQEKKKLYGEKAKLASDLKTAKAENARLQRELDASRTPAQTHSTVPGTTETPVEEDRLTRLERLVESVAGTLTRREQEAQESSRRAQLNAHRQGLLAEAREQGVGVISSLVAGDSEEELEAAFEIAKAEYIVHEQEIRAKLEAEIAASAPTTVQPAVRPVRRVPSGVPAVRTGQVTPSDTPTREEVKALTSIDAIRDGTYAQNRKKLLGMVKRITR